MRATVPHQVEFHITPATVELKVALALAKLNACALLHDGQVGLQKGVAHGLGHGHAALRAKGRKIVKKDAAHTALFVAVFEVEVFVAPALKAQIQPFAIGLEGVVADAVEMHGVFLVTVVGRQIHPPAKPAHGRVVFGLGADHAHIHVHRRHVRIERVKHQ